MNSVYHGSDKSNLNKIVPRLSTHGKRYVYATKHRVATLLFLSRWNDYLLTLRSSNINDKVHLTLVERYENAFNDIYSKRKGFLYVIDDANFFADPNCWELELVSEHDETPISCERIDDILTEILMLEYSGDISLYHYPNRPVDIPDDDTDLVQKSIELYRLNGDLYNAVYCANRFPHLKKQISDVFWDLYRIDLSSVQHNG